MNFHRAPEIGRGGQEINRIHFFFLSFFRSAVSFCIFFFFFSFFMHTSFFLSLRLGDSVPADGDVDSLG